MSTTPSPSPTRITKRAELDVLPPGAILRDVVTDAIVVVRDEPGTPGTPGLWRCDTYGGGGNVSVTNLVIMHNPAAPPVSDTTTATITEWAVRYPDGHVLPFRTETNARKDHAIGFTLGKVVVCRTVSDWVEPAALGLTVTDKADQ